MIRNIAIKNFKSFREGISVSLDNLSAFSGKNSAGKSSIYQPLLCLSQSASNNTNVSINDSLIPILSTYGEQIELGSPEELIPNKSKRMVLSIEYDNAIIDFYYKIYKTGQLVLTDQKLHADDKGEKYSYSFHLNTNDNSFLIYASNCLFFSDYSFDRSFRQSIFNQLDSKQRKYIDYQSKRRSFQEQITNLELRIKKLKSRKDEYVKGSIRSDLNNLTEQLKTIKRKYMIFESRYHGYRLAEMNKLLFKKNVKFDVVEKVIFKNHLLREIVVPIRELKNIIRQDILNEINFDEVINDIKKEEKNKDLSTVTLVVNYSSETMDSQFNMIVHINSFRGTPKRYYDHVTDKSIIDSYGYSKVANHCVPYRFNPNGEVEKATPDIAIKYWVNKILGIDDVRVIDRIQGVTSEIVIIDGNKKHPINTVGYGLGQSIPIIIQLLTRPNDYLYIIDEPEVHLHPQAQVVFSEFILTMARLGKQIILETHSEYIINNFILHSIRDSLSISLFWVVKNNGTSEIECIEYDDLGFIKNKPVGFADGMERLSQSLLDYRMTKI